MMKEEDFGKLIKNRRLSLNLTMDTVARKAGITRATLSAIESGATNCRLDFVLRVLLFLNMNIEVEPNENKKPNRSRATRTITKLDKNVNSFLIMSIEEYAASLNKDSESVYKSMLDKGVIEEIKKDYDDLHSISPDYLNQYYSALLKTPIHSKTNNKSKMTSILLDKILIITKLIELISKQYGISLDEARNLLYKSNTLKEIKDDGTGFILNLLYIVFLYSSRNTTLLLHNK